MIVKNCLITKLRFSFKCVDNQQINCDTQKMGKELKRTVNNNI